MSEPNTIPWAKVKVGDVVKQRGGWYSVVSVTDGNPVTLAVDATSEISVPTVVVTLRHTQRKTQTVERSFRAGGPAEVKNARR